MTLHPERPPVVVAHGGAGAPSSLSSGCVLACQGALRRLAQGASALEAAAEAVRVLEADGRFNAGVGATCRLDGLTVELDAGVADESGFGAVAGLTQVAHPVDVALAVRRSPHVMLAGAGAQALARRLGLWDPAARPGQGEPRVRRTRAALDRDPRWAGQDLAGWWNFDAEIPSEISNVMQDTVGAVVRDGQGRVAAAGSTGGTGYALRGRVGDTPVFGAGFYVGPAGACVATGMGEEIWRRLTCRSVHDVMAGGRSPQHACAQVCSTFPAEWDVGILAVGRQGWGAAANRDMAWAAMEADRLVGQGGGSA